MNTRSAWFVRPGVRGFYLCVVLREFDARVTWTRNPADPGDLVTVYLNPREYGFAATVFGGVIERTCPPCVLADWLEDRAADRPNAAAAVEALRHPDLVYRNEGGRP